MGKTLNELLIKLNANSLLDAPCGDFNWMKDVPLAVQSYIGLDVVPELIEANKSRFEKQGRTFRRADISNDPLPMAEVILCRDCLVHFSYIDIFRTLGNFKKSGAKYLLTTTFLLRHSNHDIETGGWRPLNLMRAPFCFPRPLQAVSDFCPDPQYADKMLGVWNLERLSL